MYLQLLVASPEHISTLQIEPGTYCSSWACRPCWAARPQGKARQGKVKLYLEEHTRHAMTARSACRDWAALG